MGRKNEIQKRLESWMEKNLDYLYNRALSAGSPIFPTRRDTCKSIVEEGDQAEASR